jgi:hypothetical protein
MPNGEACSHGAVHTNMPNRIRYPFTTRAECLECCWAELIKANGDEEPKFILDNTSKRSEQRWFIIGTGFKATGDTLHQVIRNAAMYLRNRRADGSTRNV